MDPIQQYIATVMQQAKLADLPAELRTGLEEQLAVLAYQRMGMVITAELGESKSAEFMQLIEDNPEKIDHDAINVFLTKHIDQFERKIQDALSDLAANFIAKANAPHA